ncbi:MAG: 30S ribosome-binding factor RbfA [Bacteroidetes bacterium]|nr:30S ribosome-binding factor RbfA [Bacteroidota bacterium]MBL0096029.1 30S ribosome-binding factor RbfA [Bacteroidota bacterium]
MDSVRQQKYAKLIQKELGELFQREGRGWYGPHFVTVTGVKITPDLGLARVHLSVFKAPKPLEILKSLKKHKTEVRLELGRRIGKQARIIPELEFFIDDSLDYAEKMDAIFKNLHIPPPEPEPEA